MTQEPQNQPKPERRKPRKRPAQRHYDKPLSLFPMTFDEAVTRIVRAKPPKKPAG